MPSWLRSPCQASNDLAPEAPSLAILPVGTSWFHLVARSQLASHQFVGGRPRQRLADYQVMDPEKWVQFSADHLLQIGGQLIGTDRLVENHEGNQLLSPFSLRLDGDGGALVDGVVGVHDAFQFDGAHLDTAQVHGVVSTAM